MSLRSTTRRAAQAAANSASSQEEDSSKKNISFKIGSSKANGRKKNASSSRELVPISSETDYPNSGSSVGGLSKTSSQPPMSSQDDMFATEIEELPSNASLTVPSSGSSIDYNAMKNSLTMSQESSESERLVLESPEEGTVGRVSRTSTPQKRRLVKTVSDPRMTLQNIAEEITACPEGNLDDTNVESSLTPLENLPENISTKRKRHDSQMSDSQLPDTLVSSKSDSEVVALKKCRQSVEIIGIKSKLLNSCSTPVVDLEDESDDESNRLYLSQSQSQQITPILVDVEADTLVMKDSLVPSNTLQQIANCNSFPHSANVSDCDTLPFTSDKSSFKHPSRIDVYRNEEVECLEVPNSLKTFARVKDNLSLTSRTMMPSLRGVDRSKDAHFNSSTPVINVDSDSHNTPENTNGNGVNHDDITTSYHKVMVEVRYRRSMNSTTKSCTRELVKYTIHEGDNHKPFEPLTDVSPGALADVSGQSKQASPASVTSTGMFALPPPRQSIASTTSSSTVTSAASLQKEIEYNIRQHAHSKHNNLGKNPGRDLKFEVLILETHLNKLETSVCSVFETPEDSKKEPLTNGKPPSLISKSSSSTTEDTEAESKQEFVAPTKSHGTTLSNGSSETTEECPPPSVSKSRKKVTPSKKTVAEVVSETPRSSTKKRVGRSRSTKKRSTGSRKAKMPAIIEDVPQGKEVVGREKKARAPPARKALTLTPAVEKTLRRAAAPEESTSEDILDPPITPDQPILAFARWNNDKRYYSCTVIGRTKDGKCNIKFDDGTSKNLADEFVIPVGQLRKGLSVFAKVNDEDYEPGTISKLEVKDGIVMYVVELDSKVPKSKVVTIPRSALFMTEDQAMVLQEETWGCTSPSTARRPADVSLDNMVGGKRRRFASVIRRLPKVSGENRPTSAPTPHSDTSDDVNYSTEEIYGVDIEFYPLPYPSLKDGGLSKTACKVKGRGKDIATEKTSDMQLNQLLGPIPDDGCRLFTGMQFLFTSVATAADRNAPASLNESTNYESGTASDCDSYCTIPLFKERLVAQLVAGGGVVHDKFDQLENYKDAYLIASAPCHTANYLLCLAHRIPIISHDWVISSIRLKKRQSMLRYHLPNGRSIVNGALVEQKERSSRDLMLKNVEVLIVSEADHFIGFWTKLLEAMGARVSSLLPDSDERPKETDVYVILSDNSILGSKMRTWADNFGVRVVNPEWVKYSLIKGVKGDINFEGFSIELN